MVGHRRPQRRAWITLREKKRRARMFAYAERLNPSPRYFMVRTVYDCENGRIYDNGKLRPYYGPRRSPFVMLTMPPLRDGKIPVRWVDKDELLALVDISGNGRDLVGSASIIPALAIRPPEEPCDRDE